MGGSNSTRANQNMQQVEELKMVANFTDKEINRLIAIFAKLDVDNNGSISKEEIYNVAAFKHNPFLSRNMSFQTLSDYYERRIAAIAYPEEIEKISLKEFAQLMSVFSLRAPREQKLRFAYKIYDNDDDGKISREDLKTSLKTVMQDNITDDFLEEDKGGYVEPNRKSNLWRLIRRMIFEVVTKVMDEADSDKDGYIVFDDFSKVVMDTDIEGKLTIDF